MTRGEAGEAHAAGATERADGPPAPSDFRFRHAVQVRFRDLDPMGHAHHSLPLIYFEEARAAYWRDVVGRVGLDAIDYIMAEALLRYHARIRFPGSPTVGVRVTRVGRRSLTLEYALWSESGELLASGRTVQVMYDYGDECSVPVPPEVRARIERFESGTDRPVAGG